MIKKIKMAIQRYKKVKPVKKEDGQCFYSVIVRRTLGIGGSKK